MVGLTFVPVPKQGNLCMDVTLLKTKSILKIQYIVLWSSLSLDSEAEKEKKKKLGHGMKNKNICRYIR